jgi:hypothetical protein
MAIVAAVFLISLTVLAPGVAADGPDDPPEGCTTKVPGTPIILVVGGRNHTLVPETWICPG